MPPTGVGLEPTKGFNTTLYAEGDKTSVPPLEVSLIVAMML
jgi:hypothetical protein